MSAAAVRIVPVPPLHKAQRSRARKTGAIGTRLSRSPYVIGFRLQS
jgi:hypothetical protein